MKWNRILDMKKSERNRMQIVDQTTRIAQNKWEKSSKNLKTKTKNEEVYQKNSYALKYIFDGIGDHKDIWTKKNKY